MTRADQMWDGHQTAQNCRAACARVEMDYEVRNGCECVPHAAPKCTGTETRCRP